MRGDAPRLVVLAGPTCVGKSEAAMRLARQLRGEIVSADSVQVYRGLDVGSAKPTRDDRRQVVHHCLDLFEPTEQSDAARWCAAADEAIAAITRRGLIPLVCGGTGLYLRALLHGLAAIPAIDPAIRRDVERRLGQLGPQRLHAELALLDPDAAARIAPADKQRVSRALSVVEATGRPLSDWQRAHRFAPQRYQASIHLLWPSRDQLYARIDKRAARMVEAGLVDEVRALLESGVPPSAPALGTLGYRQVVRWLSNPDASVSGLAGAVAQGHRRYAKRQLTWFRRLAAETPEARHHSDPDAAVEGVVGAVEAWP